MNYIMRLGSSPGDEICAGVGAIFATRLGFIVGYLQGRLFEETLADSPEITDIEFAGVGCVDDHLKFSLIQFRDDLIADGVVSMYLAIRRPDVIEGFFDIADFCR